jgi:hypothetical protein
MSNRATTSVLKESLKTWNAFLLDQEEQLVKSRPCGRNEEDEMLQGLYQHAVDVSGGTA